MTIDSNKRYPQSDDKTPRKEAPILKEVPASVVPDRWAIPWRISLGEEENAAAVLGQGQIQWSPALQQLQQLQAPARQQMHQYDQPTQQQHAMQQQQVMQPRFQLGQIGGSCQDLDVSMLDSARDVRCKYAT